MPGTYGGTSDYGTTGDVDDQATVPPFGANLAGVKAFVPEVVLLTGNVLVGKFGVQEAQVMAWLDEMSGTVAMTLDGWERLDDTPTEREVAVGEVPPDSDREQLRRFARTVIHNGAASYLEAARHPERATVNDTSYAAVLWARYLTGLEQLAAWLTRRLAAGGTDDTTGDYPGGASFNFPRPIFPDGFGV
jgi:hypothetical protein